MWQLAQPVVTLTWVYVHVDVDLWQLSHIVQLFVVCLAVFAGVL